MELWACESMPDNCIHVVWDTLVKYWIGPNFVQKWGHMDVAHAIVKNPSKSSHGGLIQQEETIINDLFRLYYLESKSILQYIIIYALLHYKICVDPTFL
jgi:hypothetical protein